jgi:hypothetical protein
VLAPAHTATTVITWLLVGFAGELQVILISFFEDLDEFLGKE